ncbi:MAG: alpha/beta hydrolase [Candidatus Omnitrophota bacterium]
MIRIIIFFILLAMMLFAYFRYFEYNLLYYPTKDFEAAPKDLDLTYQDIFLNVGKNIKLHGWYIPSMDSRYTILYFHGNGGNISNRLDKIAMLNKLGLDVFIFDYRGFGKSAGKASEENLYNDALASYDYLVFEKKIPYKEIILYGESLGGAVAIDLASKKKVGALITESTFSCITDIARVLYPMFPRFIIKSRFDSTSKISKINVPKLIMHSKDDDIVPFGQSIKLFNIAPNPKKHIELEGLHNSCHIDSKETYILSIRDFLKDMHSLNIN